MFKTSLRKQNLKIVNINRDIPRETLLIFSYLYKRKNCSVPRLQKQILKISYNNSPRVQNTYKKAGAVNSREGPRSRREKYAPFDKQFSFLLIITNYSSVIMYFFNSTFPLNKSWCWNNIVTKNLVIKLSFHSFRNPRLFLFLVIPIQFSFLQ